MIHLNDSGGQLTKKLQKAQVAPVHQCMSMCLLIEHDCQTQKQTNVKALTLRIDSQAFKPQYLSSAE